MIDLTTGVVSPEAAKRLVRKLKAACEAGLLERRRERNDHLLASFEGRDDGPVSPKWNVKIYCYNRKKLGHSVVCVDRFVLERLVADDLASLTPSALPVLRIDDAGWGFPLCGVMVGVTDEREVRSAKVPVEYFRDRGPNRYETGRYLDVYLEEALKLLESFEVTPETHRIEICSGYLNQPVREELRRRGFEARVVEIRGLLQDELEDRFAAYVAGRIGADLYYDPKELRQEQIPRHYAECVEFGRTRCPHLLKTGWKALRGG